MIFEIELLILLAMLATFIVLLLIAKMPSGIALMVSALVGMLFGTIFNGTEFSLRMLFEGGFGYLDTLLIIIAAMIFIRGLEMSGALEYLSVGLVKIFKKFPTVLILVFMVILMLPGMITGSSLAAVISIGAIVSPIMLKMGLPKAKVAAIIAFGAVLGMVAPPINVPVMAICDVVDIPYTGFTLPLFLLTFPLAIFAALFLSRNVMFKKATEEVTLAPAKKIENIVLLSIVGAAFVVMLACVIASYTAAALVFAICFAVLFAAIVVIVLLTKPYCAEIDLEEMNKSLDFSVLKELNWTCLIPLILIVVLFVGQSVLPKIIGILGTPLLFIISFIPTCFLGRKHNSILAVKDGVKKSVSAMGLLLGVGMFVQIMTLTGARGYIVINAISLPNVWQYVALAISMQVFGGISAFGSASILGGPFVMALIADNEIFIASALSLLAALGEFLPPTAMSAAFSAKQVEEPGYINVTKNSMVPLAVCLVYALVFVVLVGHILA